MNNLIDRVLQWGIDKGITGPNGKGTPVAQAKKMLEEAEETALAVRNCEALCQAGKMGLAMDLESTNIKDGIGDTCVTLILLAKMYGMTLEDCLTHALEIIEKRTGKMEGGTFIKD